MCRLAIRMITVVMLHCHDVLSPVAVAIAIIATKDIACT